MSKHKTNSNTKERPESARLTKPRFLPCCSSFWANKDVYMYIYWLPGGSKLRYMDHIRRILNKCNISTAELEQLSTDRDTWKSACASGLATYNVSADQAAEDRRTRRHNPANPLTTGPRCPQCSRICASEFGLRSHLRSHAAASRPHQQHS